nr:cation transporter [Bacillota bacterium]
MVERGRRKHGDFGNSVYIARLTWGYAVYNNSDGREKRGEQVASRDDFHHDPHVRRGMRQNRRALLAAFALTLIFAVVEGFGGVIAGSLALLSDAGHMAGDVLALGLSLVAALLSARPPRGGYTYGYLRFEMIVSFLNGLALVAVAGWIVVEAAQRILHPPEVQPGIMIAVAAIGLLVNLVVAVILGHFGDTENLNVRSALWHVLGDLFSSVGVVLSSAAIWMWNVRWLDPAISVLIAVVIGLGGIRVTAQAGRVLMEAAPRDISVDAIREHLLRLDGVIDVHEMHLWSITSTQHAFSCHLLLEHGRDPHQVVKEATALLRDRFGIRHSTMQTESLLVHGEEHRRHPIFRDREADATVTSECLTMEPDDYPPARQPVKGT